MTLSVLEGVLQKAWVKAQSTMGTAVTVAATDAVSPIKGSFKIDPEYPHEDSKEAVGTPTLQDELPQSKGGKWSAQFYVKPNAVGVAPDIGELIKAAMGVETVVGATSVTYSLSDTVRSIIQSEVGIADLTQIIGSDSWVEQMDIEIQKGSPPLISFSGGFATYGWAHADEVGVGGIAYNATSLPLDNDSRGCVGANARIQFVTPADDGGTSASETSSNDQPFDLSETETLIFTLDGASQTVTFADTDFVAPDAATAAEVVAAINAKSTGCTAVVSGVTKVQLISDVVGAASALQFTGGTGRTIIGFDTDAHTGTAGTGYGVTATVDTAGAATATITPAVVSRAGHIAGTVIKPWFPSQTVSGTKLTAGECALEIDSVAYGFISAKLSIATGLHGLDKEATSIRANRVAGGARSVSLDLQCYALVGNAGNAAIHGRAWASATHDVMIRVGANTAAARMTINVDEIRFDVTPLDLPEAEEAQLALKGKARQNAAAADEVNIVFD